MSRILPNRRHILTSMLTLPALCRSVQLQGAPPAFKVGEKLTYTLGWQFITAGEATLEVLPDEIIDGLRVRSFDFQAKTRKTMDHIFKVRDKLSSLAEYNVTRSLGYSKIQREGKTKRDISVDFDWPNMKAHYYEAIKGRRRVTPILENTLDPLSAFYFIRNQQFDVGSVLKGPLTDGKKCEITEVKVVKREHIKVNGKKYDTFKLEPNLKNIGGVFEKDKKSKLSIWVTADHRHIPVQLKSKVAVGNFVAELNHIENVKPQEPQMIVHSVFFKLKHPAGSVAEQRFMEQTRELRNIPGVNNFQVLNEISPKNPFTFGLSMEFADQTAYDAYSNHPDHVRYVQEIWLKEVDDFQEIDYTQHAG